MTKMQAENYRSIFRLARFLFWYGTAMVGLLFFLPWAGEALQARYEGMSVTARLISATGFFVVVGAWQIIVIRGGLRALRLRRRSRAEHSA